MKFISNIPKIIPILIFVSVLSVSCSSDDDGNNNQQPQLNIVETALAAPELSTLVAALQLADGNLVDVLSGGDYTVLAPTNDAFGAFLAANNIPSLEDVPTDLLTNILLNHVINGTVDSGTLINAGSGYATTNATNADGDNLSLFYDTSNGVKFNGGSNVSAADIGASNGVVHIIDEVIALPTVVTFATADPTFGILVSALTREDLTFDYVSTLLTPDGTSPAPFTVFAPTDAAFVDLLTELNLNSLSDIDEPTLKATLDYHAVALANVRAEDLQPTQSVGTLGGDITITLDAGPQVIDANQRVSNIIATNVQAINGVIHAIDKVILPPL